MDILIVDDSNDKIANIISVIREISPNFNIDTVIDSISAQRKLIEKKYDLLIVDLLLPLRQNEEPIIDGGKNLVLELERNSKLKSPNYIIGITQYQEQTNNFSNIWNVLHYSPSSFEWKNILKRIISHITRATLNTLEKPEIKKPTIFVEGKSDEIIILEAIRLFYPDLESKVFIKSERSAGASWVARQIIIWGSSLTKDNNEKYIKAVGLLDGDQAGNNAKEEINRVITSTSAGSQTFKVIQLSPSYARELISHYKKGIKIPICLEEMLPINYWKIAESKGWLENSQNTNFLLDDPKGWDKMNHSLSSHLFSLGLTNDEMIYLKRFTIQGKEESTKYIASLPNDEKKDLLKNFDNLIKQIKNEMNLI